MDDWGLTPPQPGQPDPAPAFGEPIGLTLYYDNEPLGPADPASPVSGPRVVAWAIGVVAVYMMLNRWG